MREQQHLEMTDGVIVPMWLNSTNAVVLAKSLIAKNGPQTTHSPLGFRASHKSEREARGLAREEF